jgi:hypothetical protein
MSRKSERRRVNLLVGAKAIADYVYGDEAKWRSIYGLEGALGLFRLGGQICGRPTTIDARIEAREPKAERSTTA